MEKTYRINWKYIISSLCAVTMAMTIMLLGSAAVFADSEKYIDRMPINMSETSFIYNGTEQVPEISIDGLTEGEDYSVEFSEGCVEPGTYNAVISGINDGTDGYFGTVIRSFSINKYTYRVFGDTRIDTAIEAAELMRDGGTFDTVVLAYGWNYPDALAGSYLAIGNDAPILLIDDSSSGKIIDYLDANLAADGKVYILGAEAVVSEKIESTLNAHGFDVTRLGGATRYETNLKILNAGSNNSGKPLVVCTGEGFADSLSASTSGAPIMLVDPVKGLNAEQKAYIESNGFNEIIICGGVKAVPASVETALKKYGDVDRLDGETRYETSKIVAEEFTDPEATTVFLAYGESFPDGLCAGPLAAKMGAALLLTNNNATVAAQEYVNEQALGISYVMGGPKLISDATVKKITGAN